MIGLRDRVGLAALSFSLVLLPAAAPQSTPQSSDGLYFSNFETPEGKVTVILPADLRAGDTLSGTVWADEARPSSGAPGGGARLSGYVLEVDDQKVDPSAATFTHTVPQGASKPVTVRLLSPQGRALGEAFLPLVRPVPEPPSVDRFTAPSLVQAGQPIQIKGPFSGDLAASRLSVGGTAARPLAQSPRNGWWQVPPEVTGPADVELVQDGTTHEGETRSVGVQPSADRLNLQRGETTRMRIHVSGLEGLEQPIPLTLSNETPSVVSLEGGDSQTVTIPPSEVSPDGTWQGTRTVTGRVRGSYNLRVRVVPDSLWPWVVLDLEPPVPIQGPPDRPRVRSFDTDEDGNDDLDVRSWDFDRNGEPDKVHFDTNRNGRIDDGEKVVEGVQKYGHQPMVGKGFKFELTVWAGPVNQIVQRTIVVKNANGDGDTADPGELKE